MDLGVMTTFEDWDKGDAIRGLVMTFAKRMQDDLTALQ